MRMHVLRCSGASVRRRSCGLTRAVVCYMGSCVPVPDLTHTRFPNGATVRQCYQQLCAAEAVSRFCRPIRISHYNPWQQTSYLCHLCKVHAGTTAPPRVQVRVLPISRDVTWELGRRTYIMAILNITPDSFSDGGCCDDLDLIAACHSSFDRHSIRLANKLP